ncbi:MAG: 50S ribosomal protein L32 [Pseudomonadota bacterium]
MAAVPKQKISARRTRVRRKGNSLFSPVVLACDAKSGFMYRNHRMCLQTGMYNGKKVVEFVKKTK